MGELVADLKHSLINPDENFVQMAPVDANAATKMISEDDIAQIKGRTSSIVLDEPAQKPVQQTAERPVVVPNIARNEVPKKQAPLAVNDEDDEDDDDLDPKMEKLTAVLAIIAAVIIALILLVLVGKGMGVFNSKTPETTTPNATEEEMIAAARRSCFGPPPGRCAGAETFIWSTSRKNWLSSLSVAQPREWKQKVSS